MTQKALGSAFCMANYIPPSTLDRPTGLLELDTHLDGLLRVQAMKVESWRHVGHGVHVSPKLCGETDAVVKVST